MSSFSVNIRSDFQILPHPNADRLVLLQFGGEGGFISVVGKDQFKPGDKVLYVPVDAVLPEPILNKLRETSKIDLKSPRVRAIRLRQILSQGLCLKPEEWLDPKDIVEGTDVAEKLGIKKYQPPEPEFRGFSGKGVSIQYQNDNFDRYTDIEHYAKFPSSIKPGDLVVATVKYHGTNFRAGIVRKPYYKESPFIRLIKKIGYFFGVTQTQHEFLVGSHNTIRVVKKSFGRKEVEDLYVKTAEKYSIRKILEKELVLNPEIDEIIVYGEIIGPGIQKGYSYGITVGEHNLVIFDVKINGKYAPWDDLVNFVVRNNLQLVEPVYRGPFNRDVPPLAQKVDQYGEVKHTREGIVVRPLDEKWDAGCGRVILKIINPDYLTDTTNSDLH